MITPSDIENKEFTRAKHGYDEVEVDEFLDLIIVDMEKLIRENKQLREDLQKASEQVDKHLSTETSVYDTLESAKQLMNDIAASAERRAEVLLKQAELEAEVITREAKESISRMNEDAARLKTRYDKMKSKYKEMLLSEIDKIDGSDEFFEEFARDFIQTGSQKTDKVTKPTEKPDLSKTMIHKL